MKIKDYIFLAMKNLSRRRKSVFFSFILIVLSMLIFIVALSFSSGILNAMDRAILKNISYRTIAVMESKNTTLDFNTIEKLEHVVKCVSQDYYETSALVKNVANKTIENGVISLFSFDSKTLPNIVLGREPLKGERNVCIIPVDFYPYDVRTCDKSKIYNARELLGHEITIEYNSYDYDGPYMDIKETFEKKFIVVGVYDQNETMSEVNDCYVFYEDLKEIVDIRLENNNYSNMDNRPLMAIVDDAQNVNLVLDKLKSMGYRAIVRSTANTQLIGVISIACILVSSILIFIAIVNVTISSIKSMTERNYEIGILKAIGYKKRNIQGILFAENLIISFSSYVVAMILSYLIVHYVQVKYIQLNFQLMQMKLGINISFCIISFIVTLIIPAISSGLCGKKILRRTPISLNKER